MHPARIRVAIWGLLLIWIGVMMVVNEPAGVASIGAGAILLLGGLFRRAMGGRAGFILTLAGILLLAVGIRDLGGDEARGIPLFAVVLIAIGAFVIARALGRPPEGSITIVRRYGGPPPQG